jgi:subtilisin family serine protease
MSGKVVTAGDVLQRSNLAREQYQVDGNGIKVGIISTGFDAGKKASLDVAAGELPGIGNPEGNNTSVRILKDTSNAPFGPLATNPDEGRAMAQIVHDIAPKAELLYHTVQGNSGLDGSYADAINALVEAGADVIVEDIGSTSPFFQNDRAAQAAQAAIDNGVVFLAAAGNSGNISYEDKFRAGGTGRISVDPAVPGTVYEFHDFDRRDPGGDNANVDLFQDVTLLPVRDAAGNIQFPSLINPLLSWSEPIDRVTSQIGMVLLNKKPEDIQNIGIGDILANSVFPDSQNVDDPLQSLTFQPFAPLAQLSPAEQQQRLEEYFAQPEAARKLYLAIVKQPSDTAAPDRIKWINNNNGSTQGLQYEYTSPETSGTVYNPANLADGIAVGAVDITDYQKRLQNNELPRTVDYSSRGGSELLFDNSGDPLLNPVRPDKPDIVSLAGGDRLFPTTTVQGFEAFPGTSAAAPHAAGVVALMLQAAGGDLSPAEVKDILQKTSLSLAPEPGVNSANGLIQADRAVGLVNSMMNDNSMFW